MDKEGIRRFVLSKRNMLSVQEIREKSRVIHEKLFTQAPEFAKAQCVFVYLSFGSEVSTPEIIEKCMGVGKKVCVPVVLNQLGDMVAAEFSGFDRVKENSFGIKEPFPVKEVPLEEISLVLAPGVAFDENFNRIGFGRGYYDRFLSRLPRKVPVIALAFDFQVVDSVPVTQSDVKIKKIITEKRIIK